MLSDPRFFKEWRKNEKFVNDALKLDEDMIKLLTSYSTKKFKDWNWKKEFQINRKSNGIFIKSFREQ